MEWIRLNELAYAIAATISVCGIGVLSSFFLKRKHNAAVCAAGWGIGIIVYFILVYTLFILSNPMVYDFYLFVGWLGVITTAIIVLYKESLSTKIFVAVSGVFISNVCSFLSGSTTSLLIRNVNPWGDKGYTFILPFAAIKLVITSIVLSCTIILLRKKTKEVFEVMEGKMSRFTPIPFVASIGFFCIVTIVQKYGLIVSEGIYFAAFFIIICGTYILMYWLIYSNVLWSTAAMRTQMELSVASSIQKNMLPCIFPPFPEHKEFDIIASMQPAKEVGGDFYDFFLIDNDHMAVVIADVSGKGVPAALFMVISKTLIKNHALALEEPKDIFTNVNKQLCENNEEGMFVTAWMGILEISTGKFTYANAGHNLPLIRKNDGSFEFLKSKAGFVLAGMEGIKYSQAEMQLEAGDILYLYTDGVTEATDTDNQLYGDDRIREVVNNLMKHPFEEMLERIKADIDRFVKGAPQFDDITMLALKINEKD